MTPLGNSRIAFTLIETLAIIMILSLTAAIGSISLVNGNDQARVQAAVAAWQDMDAMARLHARAGSPVRMALDNDASVILLRSQTSDAPLRKLILPIGWTPRLHVDDRPTDCILIDRLGRSVDYQAQMRPDGSGQEPVGWTTCGLTGWVIEGEISQ